VCRAPTEQCCCRTTVLPNHRQRPRIKEPMIQPPVVTTEPVYTCVRGKNADLIANVVALYVEPGQRVLDATYGRGTFWTRCDRNRFSLVTADLARPADANCDFRDMPFDDGHFHHAILDPPYMHDGKTVIVRNQYNNQITTGTMGHDDVIQMYTDGMRECARVLKPSGFIWVKTQDEVCSGCQRLSHVEIILSGHEMGLYVRDLFVLHQSGRPILQNRRQKHARKNHSFLLLFQKGAKAKLAKQTNLLRRVLSGTRNELPGDDGSVALAA
jgi:hypothetical protein